MNLEAENDVGVGQELACAVGLVERMTRRKVHAPAVQPGIGIAQAPERDPGDGIAMLQKHLEHLGVAPRELLLYFVGKPVRVRVGDRGIGAASIRLSKESVLCVGQPKHFLRR